MAQDNKHKIYISMKSKAKRYIEDYASQEELVSFKKILHKRQIELEE